jgi:hypothetical protein
MAIRRMTAISRPPGIAMKAGIITLSPPLAGVLNMHTVPVV